MSSWRHFITKKELEASAIFKRKLDLRIKEFLEGKKIWEICSYGRNEHC